MYSYFLFLLILLPCLALSAYASAKVNMTFNAYDKTATHSAMTGYDAATRLMRNRGVTDISVNRIGGRLSDHYHPAKKEVNLSESVYGSPSVAAVAVAAHEVGHVMQKKTRYVPFSVRNALVPVANVGSRLALPFILVGILLDLLWYTSPVPVGQYVMYVGIGLYSLSTVFLLITLPVEFNASRRARKMLLEDGVITEDELPGVKKVLSAAALTYVASLLISLVYFLRMLLIVFSFTRRRD